MDTRRYRNYSFLTLDFSLFVKVRVWFFISVEYRSFISFLSTRRICRSALTVCLRDFFSSLVSFVGRMMVIR